MPEVSSKTLADRIENASLLSTRSTLKGDVELTPSNLFPNPYFRDIDEDRHPDCLEVAMPEKPDGYFVYLSTAGGDPSTMAAQNTTPIPLSAMSYVTSQTWVGGHPAPSPTMAAPVAPPALPTYQLINTTRGGFPAGTWYLTYSLMDDFHRQTEVAPTVNVTVSEGQGIRVPIPNWLSAPGAGLIIYAGQTLQTLTAQIILDGWDAPQSVLLTSYISGEDAPTYNDTAGYVPRFPDFDIRTGPTELQPGTYQARGTVVTALGESRPSDYTDAIVVTEPMPNTSLFVSPGYKDECLTKDSSAATAFRHRIYVTKDGQEYVAFDSSAGSPQRTASSDDEFALSGHTQDDAPLGYTYLLGPGTAPTTAQIQAENQGQPQDPTAYKGLDPPTTPLGQPTAEGLAVLPPGTYWFAISYAIRGKETLPTTPQQVTITTGKMLRIVFTPPINVLPNPNIFEIDAQGTPYDHILVTGTGLALANRVDGSITLDTLGNQTTGTAPFSPYHQVSFPIDRSVTYKIGATFDVATLSAGTFEQKLEELSDTNTVLATTVIRSIAGTGHVRTKIAFGPDGSVQWNASTVSVRITHSFVGATRNGRVVITNMFAHYGLGEPRRAIPPPTFIRAASNPDVKSSYAWPGYAQMVVSQRPRPSRAVPTSKLDAIDFGTGSLPASWILHRTNVAGTVSQVTTTAAVSPVYGWNIQKTSSQDGPVYLSKNFGPVGRQNLAVRASVRVRQLPTPYYSYCSILSIRTADSTGYANLLGEIILDTGADAWLQGYNSDGSWDYYHLGGGINVGDVLDVELIAYRKADGTGQLNAAFGRNGARRKFLGKVSGYDWAANPTWANVGVSAMIPTKQKWNFDFDDVVITDTGDQLNSSAGPPELVPLELPDSPIKTGTPIEAEYNFDNGAISPNLTTARTPADATTSVTVMNAAAIEGPWGVRIADTGTVTTAQVYLSRVLATSRTALGARARVRVTARPSAGEVALLGLVDTAGTLLGSITLDSTGTLYARPYSAGVAGAGQRIATGIVNGNVLHIDLVGVSGGTPAGRLSAWVSIGGTGSVAERQLLYESPAPLNWSAAQIREARVGGLSEGSALSTWTFDVDSILLTESGEVLFAELTPDGDPINQVHIHLPVGSPARDDIGPRSFRQSVVPGDSYTAAIKARFAGVTSNAKPFYFTAYDTEGNATPLGSIFDVAFPNGIAGTYAWADYANTFVIPPNCYEVRLDSRAMGTGEYVFQELAFSPGTVAVRDVTYPALGLATFTLDSREADQTGIYLQPARPWLEVGALVAARPNTSYTVQYRSHRTQVDGFSQWVSDPTLLPEQRYVDAAISFASSDNKNSPVLRSGSPFVRYAFMVAGQQTSTLLRSDRSEFGGGVLVTDFSVPYRRAPHSISMLPSGRVARQRLGDPIGYTSGCVLYAFTEATVIEIQETCQDRDFVIESRDKLYRIRFSGQIEFDPPEPADSIYRLATGEWQMMAQVEDTGPIEILEIVPFNV